MSYASIRSRVRDLAQMEDTTWFGRMDSDTDTDTEEHRAIQAALRAYSLARPRRLVARWAALGGTDDWQYLLSTYVTGWDDDWLVEKVVYPEGDQDRNKIDPNEWELYKRPSDGLIYLRFLASTPASGENIALYYVRPHVLDSTTDSITTDFPQDVGAFEQLAAAECLEIAANYYARSATTTVVADSVAYSQKSSAYAKRAQECRDRYERHIARGRKTTCVHVEWDQPMIGGTASIRFPARHV